MAIGSQWTAGNLFTSLSFNPAFNAADLNSLANGSSVLSSVAAFSNGTALDQYLDLSVELTVASSAIASGSSLAFWLAMLQEDGSTLGDGTLTPGTQAAVMPVWTSLADILLFASTRTTLIGSETGLLIPPGNFALVMQNNSGVALAASGNICRIRTYNEGISSSALPSLNFSEASNSQYLGAIM
jgi:hypothetical protein